MRHVAAGRDAVVVMPTGAGKSLCYQLPGLVRDGLTLVVSPLVALIKDQVDALVGRGLRAAAWVSGMSDEAKGEVAASLRSGALKFLFVAPERFGVPGFLERLEKVRIGLMAVDEAHCIVSWGHDFRPDYLALGQVRRALGDPPCIALTATATPAVRTEITACLGLPRPRIFVSGFDRPGLRLSVETCEDRKEKQERLLEVLERLGRPALVYAATRREVEAVAAFLAARGVPAAYYHAGLPGEARARIQDAFLAGKLPILVATNAFGMGIDHPGIRAVVHWQMPGSLEAYLQEVGRAGRDGAPAEAVLLYRWSDRRIHEYLLGQRPRRSVEVAEGEGRDRAVDARERNRAGRIRLDAMSAWAESPDCRRRTLLEYFGEVPAWTGCGTCDHCRWTPRDPVGRLRGAWVPSR